MKRSLIVFVTFSHRFEILDPSMSKEIVVSGDRKRYLMTTMPQPGQR